MIPKIIHQIWLGPKKPPQWCMDTWSLEYIQQHPDWTYRLWTEHEINQLSMTTREKYEKEPTYRGKSDIVRCEILYQFGGIYIDADSLCICPSRNLLNLFGSSTFVAGREPVNKQFIANGVIACQPHHPIMLQMITHFIKNYDKLKKQYPHKYQIWLVTNQPTFTTYCEQDSTITVVDSSVFYPEGFQQGNKEIPIETLRNKYSQSYMYQYWLSHYE